MDISAQLNLFLLHRLGKTRQYVLSALAVGLAAGVCYLFSSYIGSETVAFILLLVLSVLAMSFDILPVLMAAALSALIWDFLFIYPHFNFQVGTTEDKIMLSMYFVIALINGVLTFKLRQMEKIAQQKEKKEQTLHLYNTLLNSLSHELRTPIATILGATDNLLANPPSLSAEDRKNLLGEISIASLRLNQQVENLLNMSRLESGFIRLHKDWCNIGELINAAVRRAEDQCGQHILSVYVREDLPLFKLDYGLMEQVLYNLVNNASQYTPPGSRILIRADQSEQGLLILEVEDNGWGLPEDEIGRVFEKFYRLDSTHTGGTGLGLSIVKGFVEAHEGTIALANARPSGAIFTIRIPAERFRVRAQTFTQTTIPHEKIPQRPVHE